MSRPPPYPRSDPVGADNSVAGNDGSERVTCHRCANGTPGSGPSRSRRHRGVSHRRAPRYCGLRRRRSSPGKDLLPPGRAWTPLPVAAQRPASSRSTVEEIRHNRWTRRRRRRQRPRRSRQPRFYGSGIVVANPSIAERSRIGGHRPQPVSRHCRIGPFVHSSLWSAA